MEIFHSWKAITEKGRRAAVTIGNFDGLHLAHQELLRRVRQRAKERNAASVAITFDPHPVQVLAPQKAHRRLTPLPVKLELLEKSGIDRLLVLPFTEEFSRWSPERFVEEVLVKALQSESVWVGENFRFGHRQAGTPETMKELGLRWNFQTEVLPQVRFRTTTVSSSQIRCLLQNGNLSMTNRLLGRAFSIRSSVQAGLGIGRNQTVPTLNLAPYDGILPAGRRRGGAVDRCDERSELGRPAASGRGVLEAAVGGSSLLPAAGQNVVPRGRSRGTVEGAAALLRLVGGAGQALLCGAVDGVGQGAHPRGQAAGSGRPGDETTPGNRHSTACAAAGVDPSHPSTRPGHRPTEALQGSRSTRNG